MMSTDHRLRLTTPAAGLAGEHQHPPFGAPGRALVQEACRQQALFSDPSVRITPMWKRPAFCLVKAM